MKKVLSLAIIGLASASLCGLASADSGSATTNLTLIVPVANSVTCNSPAVTASVVGVQTMTVTCTITGNANDFAPTGNAFSPSTATLTHTDTVTTLSANLQSAVSSPDSTVTSISGNSGGFTADLSGSSPWKVETTYETTTTATTKSGTYTSDTITYAWSMI